MMMVVVIMESKMVVGKVLKKKFVSDFLTLEAYVGLWMFHDIL